MSVRIPSAASAIVSHPPSPGVIGTTVCSALPSVDGTGPATLSVPPSTSANAVASCAALARSAAVSPDGRSYTTMAGKVSSGWNDRCSSSTLVDSAFAGSQDAESLSCAPVSLPASGPRAASSTTHRARTSHLVRRPQGNLAILPAVPLTFVATVFSTLRRASMVVSFWWTRLS